MTTRTLLPIATGRRAAAALWQQARRRPLLLIMAVLTTIAASVSSVLAPLLLGRIVDAVIAEAPTRDLLLLVGGLVGSALAMGVLLGLANRCVQWKSDLKPTGLWRNWMPLAGRMPDSTAAAVPWSSATVVSRNRALPSSAV